MAIPAAAILLLAAALAAVTRLRWRRGDRCSDDTGDTAAFGLRLFEKLCGERESTVVMSPLMIAGALALAAAGATPAGAARAQLLGALGARTPADHAALAARVLAGNGAAVRGANGVFAGASIKPSFVSLAQSVHGSAAAPLGTSYAPINAWVAEKTEGRIRELLAGRPGDDDVAVLVSAVFFKGSWATQFSPALTQSANFTSLGGEGVAAQLMQRVGLMAASREVAALGGAAAVRLDYGQPVGGDAPHDYCALFVLPQEEGAEGLAATVAAVARASLPEALSELWPQEVRLLLPRLRATYGTSSIKTALRSLGVAEPFDRSGGFGALTDDPTVRISDVLTKATIELDEEGTVATAAAAVVFGDTCSPDTVKPPPLKLTFDRPFVMAVLHVPTGYPLFLARVLEPGK